MYVETYETSSYIILFSNMRFFVMFVTAVCVLFLIDQRHLRDTARTKIQPNVAWAKLNADWIRGKGFRVGRGGGVEVNK